MSSGEEHRRAWLQARKGDRFWWHSLVGKAYLPPVFSLLDDREWTVMEEWFEETDRKKYIGECAVPFISLVEGIVLGNAVSRIVQLGTYAGYSTLLIGFMAKRMKAPRAVFSVDIDPATTAFAQTYLDRAGLTDHVHLEVSDSADPLLPGKAREYLRGDPEMVVIDSSHQFEHTLRELDLWFPCLIPAGIIVMHDSGAFAQQFDSSGRGGVSRALEEWTRGHASEMSFVNLGSARSDFAKAYKDGCGIAILQKNDIV